MYRPERERGGFCRIWFYGGETRIVERTARPLIVNALGIGRRMVEVKTLYGCSTAIVLMQVSEVEDVSPESIEAFDAEEEERRLTSDDGEDEQYRWRGGR